MPGSDGALRHGEDVTVELRHTASAEALGAVAVALASAPVTTPAPARAALVTRE